MHATIRRYEGIDVSRINDIVGKVNDTLVPKLRELRGFAGYYPIEGSNSGLLSSLGLFETSEQADQSTMLVSKLITDEKFDAAIPNPPKIISGKAVANSERVLAVAYSKRDSVPRMAAATRSTIERVIGDKTTITAPWLRADGTARIGGIAQVLRFRSRRPNVRRSNRPRGA